MSSYWTNPCSLTVNSNLTDSSEKSKIPSEKATYIPNRIFLNQLDTFNNAVISNLLVKQTFTDFNKKLKTVEAEENEQEEVEEEDEEENEGETEEEEWEKKKLAKPKIKWEIIGTVQSPNINKIEDILEIVTFEQNDQFMDKVFKCGVIIIDITINPQQIEVANYILDEIIKRYDKHFQQEPKAFARKKEMRFFILITNVLTWALTKPLNPEDPDTPFQEVDYRKRKPHPSYKAHCQLEKKVVQLGKKFPNKFKTLVLCTGITYGLAEEHLSFIFEMAWQNKPRKIPIFGKGRNYIPLLHVKDLATIVGKILKKLPNISKKYILAVEQQPTRQKQIIQAVSKTMGTGEVENIMPEEAFLYPDITQANFDVCMINLLTEPDYILNEIEMRWQSDLNLPENAEAICNEFKKARKLVPIRVVMHGPPAVGKTLLAKRICKKYCLHYLHVKDIIENTLKEINDKIAELRKAQELSEKETKGKDDEEDEEDQDDEDAREKPTIEDYENQRDEIQKAMKANSDGKLPDDLTIKLIKQKMYKNELLNPGWVLDGYPKTTKQANLLFGEAEDDEEDDEAEEESGNQPKLNKNTAPEFVFSLMATDEFLCERMMNLPESEVQGTHYAEEHMLRRLEEFRKLNEDEVTVLNFYDENEIHPILLNVMDDKTRNMQETFEKICEIIGEQRSLGPSQLELEERERSIELDQIERENREKIERIEFEQRLKTEYRIKMEKWADMMLQLRREEEEILAVQSAPLRNYLMTYVFPTLTKGLLEVARLKPDDPIDYLAEYLFKENPEGKMFDPAYTAAAGEFMSAVQNLQDVLTGNTDELETLRCQMERLSREKEDSPERSSEINPEKS